MLARLARFSYQRRKFVVLAWILFVFATGFAGSAFKGEWETSGGGLSGTDSQEAFDLLKSEFPAQSGEDSAFVFGDITKDSAAITTFLADAAKVEGIGFVQQQPEIAPNGQIATASFTLLADPGEDARTAAAVEELRKLAEPLSDSGGVAFTNWRFDEMEMPKSELFGIMAAIVVLLVAFGSVLAMGLPIITGVLGIMIASSMIAVLARFMSTPGLHRPGRIDDRPRRRHRLRPVHRQPLPRRPGPPPSAGRGRGRGPHHVRAGRAVRRLHRDDLGPRHAAHGAALPHGLAVGTSIAVALAVGRRPHPAARPCSASSVSTSTSSRSTARTRSAPGSASGPAGPTSSSAGRSRSPSSASSCSPPPPSPSSASASASADAGNNPEGSTTKTAYDLTAQGFGPGANGRMLIVADTSEGSSAGLAGVVDALRKVPGVVMVTDFMPAPDGGKAAIATLIASTGPQDEATESLVHHLRNDVVPAAEAATGLQVHVGGTTALGMDFASKISERLPIFIGAVLLLSFLLLLMVFRSVVVPLKAVIMNLLSIGAAYGVMVAVFQWGWFGSIVGVSGAPIEAWAPMMLFAIVFGLSMDYEVFLLSAIKEEYDATGDNAHAVATGLAVTGRLITAAGLIMVCVFGSFVLMRHAGHEADRASAWQWPWPSTPPSSGSCWCRRPWSCSATPTGGCPAGSTGSCPTWPWRVRRRRLPPALRLPLRSRPAARRTRATTPSGSAPASTEFLRISVRPSWPGPLGFRP